MGKCTALLALGVSYYMVFEANLLTPLPSILSFINEIEDNLLLK
jgi:hypothetical protein